MLSFFNDHGCEFLPETSLEYQEYNGAEEDLEDAPEFYSAIGDAFKTNWPGFSAWIISSDAEALKSVGLKTKRKIQCFNGPLECRWVGYDLYKGSATSAEDTITGEDSESPEITKSED